MFGDTAAIGFTTTGDKAALAVEFVALDTGVATVHATALSYGWYGQ